MKFQFLPLIILALLFSACDKYKELEDGLYAEVNTSKGTILLELHYEKAPITVANFVTLAEGKNTFVRDDMKGKPFYNGLVFHRVIKDFMIQGGDPLGNGAGDAGYKFGDEITDLKHEKGVLSMANSGPGTNSSQFFITHVETPWLDGLHTVFGKVATGMEVVNNISQGDLINSIKIVRIGEDAKKFNAVKTFADHFSVEAENLSKRKAIEQENKRLYRQKYEMVLADQKAYFDETKAKATKTNTGLRYVILDKGTGSKPSKGEQVFIHYAGFFETGEVFDTSIEQVAKTFGTYDERRAAAVGYQPAPFVYGTKRGMIPGFIEGIEKLNMGGSALIFVPAHLGYGPQGAGDVIPPDTNLVFEIRMRKDQSDKE
ncbi:MAG: peptidylprolyl isomerase [Flavobacterium sp.]|nr:peptidylprolyl isomerase [Flavobacterium sp.]